MKWGIYPHPLMEIARKTFLEIRHQVNPNNVNLVGFGADARKLYFQFSFIERINCSFSEFEINYNDITNNQGRGQLFDNPSELVKIPFNLEDVVNYILKNNWEPAAAATLLTICAMSFGKTKIFDSFYNKKELCIKHTMKDEWDYRASHGKNISDMSVRYPADKFDEIIKDHYDKLFQFMGNDIKYKKIIEIGCGTGIITERLITIAKQVTCVDLCEKMIRMNKERLADNSNRNKVIHVIDFAQDFLQSSSIKYQVAICSRVLIHNVNDSYFKELVKQICKHSDIVYVFEDVSERHTSEATKLRNKRVLIDEFNSHAFSLNAEKMIKLDIDDIVLLKFVISN
jgi:2-polyprenyl-3-methyl-5-hydroxy-6-metoxy-1,4-benzoquinol methylase